MPGMNLYFTTSQYRSQSFPYLIAHLATSQQVNQSPRRSSNLLTSQSHAHTDVSVR